ncbi:MAG: hypothetical protein KIT36_14775 [Alphaproteobacteria bacterium]|nr:hypothetical protein [Alphaproteobacteria bacterium]
MGDQTWGYQPPSPSGAFQLDTEFGYGYRKPLTFFPEMELKLDPEIERQIQEIEASLFAKMLLERWLDPDFKVLLPHWSTLISAPPVVPYGPAPPSPVPIPYPTTSSPTPKPSAPPKPAGPPGADAPKPKPADLSDLAKAIYKTEAVQGLVKQAHDEAWRQLRVLRQQWQQSNTATKVVSVSVTGVVVGGALTAILVNQPTRERAFGLLKDRDIPVPYVPGLTFKYFDNELPKPSTTYTPGPPSPLPGPGDKPLGQGVMVNFDVTEFIRSRQKKK